MAKRRGGLTKWFEQDWVDIGAPKKGGGYAKCGRSKLEKDRKRNTLSVCQLLKLHGCQRHKLNQQ